MPAITEPRSGLQYGWNLGENNWHIGMDANLLSIGRFGFHLSVLDRDLNTPPVSPATSATYIVGNSPTGAWAGHASKVAVWSGTAWVFGTPRTGWLAYIEDEEKLSAYKVTSWSPGIPI